MSNDNDTEQQTTEDDAEELAGLTAKAMANAMSAPRLLKAPRPIPDADDSDAPHTLH